MSFPRYLKYKASGVEWLGEVPEHWSRSALKRLADYENGFPYKPEDRGNSGRPIIRISQLTSDDPPAYFEGSVEGHVPIEDGDLLFSWSASIDAFIWQRGPALLNQHIFKVTPSEGVYKRYLFHLIRHVAPKLADFDAHGSTMRHIKKESLGEVTYLPPLAEQRAIAAFLDRETKKIDELVAEQERLIELLKEKRQAVISHAVTKGLDPAAPMKPSGVEWLGDVPAHWEVASFRHCLSQLFNGLTATQVDEADSTVPVTRIESISDGVIDETRLGFVKSEDAREDRKLLCGDLLFSNINSLRVIGNCAFYGGGRMMYAGMNLLVFRPNSRCAPRWLYWLVCSSLFRSVVAALAKPAINQASISQSSINSILVVRPRMTEQIAIAEFLDRATGKIDTLVAQAESAMALLTERRSALISAAVTGQIDVRNAVPSATPTEAA